MGAKCCVSKAAGLGQRTDTDSYVRQSSSQEYRDGGLTSSVDRYGNSIPRQQRINAPLLAENGPTQTTFGCQPSSSTEPLERRQVQQYHYRSETRIDPEEVEKREQLEHWLLQQPLSARKLDQSDRHVAMLSDERDGIQKKTFTKWVNKHLAKAGCKVDDLFVDLRDGFSLIALLEVLTGERLPRENGYTRFHRIQNVQYCLDFLKKKSIKLVNIRPEDIVEGNGKLTLGLIWTIILNFQVSVIKRRQLEESLLQSPLHNSSHYQIPSAEAIQRTTAPQTTANINGLQRNTRLSHSRLPNTTASQITLK